MQDNSSTADAGRTPGYERTSGDYKNHIGNGVFGGLLPLIGLSVIASTGNIYAGLYYPMAVASLTFIIGSLMLRETKNVLIRDEVERAATGAGNVRSE